MKNTEKNSVLLAGFGLLVVLLAFMVIARYQQATDPVPTGAPGESIAPASVEDQPTPGLATREQALWPELLFEPDEDASELELPPSKLAPVPDLAEAEPLITRLDALTAKADSGNLEAARKLVSGLLKCNAFRPYSQEQIERQARERVEFRMQLVTAQLAEQRDEALVDKAIEEIAALDPDEMNAQVRAEMLERQRYCGGMESYNRKQRDSMQLHAIETAARLGSYSDRSNFVSLAFFRSEDFYQGNAAEIARRKQLARGFIREGLIRRDLDMLNQVSGFVGEGFFDLPDPIAGYAYALAVLRAPDEPRTAWHFIGDEPLNRAFSDMMTERRKIQFASQLSNEQIAQAEELAKAILKLPGKES